MTKCKHCGVDKEEIMKLLAEIGRASLERIDRLEELRNKKLQILKDSCY